ncbi:hypothetical protein BJ508DRAFT_153037 [Ascobolus immersus RN42]|uniref:FAD/NAD(P)-binding domain-containing protein n=1 Tax=Ascobolus immersus RN42 TaxID=1160509 RepID=A0A3N4I1V2_ASCIM|nr:hypothetical protein BJ508DRAFT_153037 [Ascobolus immersus RN42]
MAQPESYARAAARPTIRSRFTDCSLTLQCCPRQSPPLSKTSWKRCDAESRHGSISAATTSTSPPTPLQRFSSANSVHSDSTKKPVGLSATSPHAAHRETRLRRKFQELKSTREYVDTLVVGTGPAALFLSYLLEGNTPCYDPSRNGPHPDSLLHSKLSDFIGRPLYDAIDTHEAVEELTAHFQNSSQMSYSTQALPVNVLFDTLLRPNADLDVGEAKPRLSWRHDGKRHDHIVIGDSEQAGGQWGRLSDCGDTEDSQTLSYAEMLSLPGYSYASHFKRRSGKDLPEFTRPTRREVADYLRCYPAKVGISSSIFYNITIDAISRGSGDYPFKIRMHSTLSPSLTHCISAKNVVLATGLFSSLFSPPPTISPLLSINKTSYLVPELPMLVIGSGFSAADAIIASIKKKRPIIHVYKWKTASFFPLKGCHPSAYPDYSRVYRRMKQFAVGTTSRPTTVLSPGPDDGLYEGFADAEVQSATLSRDGLTALVTFVLPDGSRTARRVAGMRYLVGRYSSLDFLEPPLMTEIGVKPGTQVRAATLRESVEDSGLEISKGLFVIGSLTGDSLVKFGLGGGVWVAGRVTKAARESTMGDVNSSGLLSTPDELSTKLDGTKSPASPLNPRRGCLVS